eukprot:m.51825 g.51825  ORF g.51825 m.51825 type:complete len:94 (-) comp7586_c0_seq2:405-686(-)
MMIIPQYVRYLLQCLCFLQPIHWMNAKCIPTSSCPRVYLFSDFDRRTIGSKWPYKQVHGEDQPVSSVSRQDSHETKPLAPFRNYTANTFSTTV